MTSGSGSRWQYLGRDYALVTPWAHWAGPGICLWVICDRVDRDLGLGQIVDNARRQKVLDFVQNQWLAALDRLCLLAIEGQARPNWSPLLGYCVECLVLAGHRQQALELQKVLASQDDLASRYRLQVLSGAQPRLELQAYDAKQLFSLWRAARALRSAHHSEAMTLAEVSFSRALEESRPELVVEIFEQAELSPNPMRRAQIGGCYLRLGRLEQAQIQLQLALESAPLGDWSAEAAEWLAEVQCRLGAPRAAAATLAELLRQRQAEWGQRSRRLGPLLSQLKLICEHLGDQKLAQYYQGWMVLLDSA